MKNKSGIMHEQAAKRETWGGGRNEGREEHVLLRLVSHHHFCVPAESHVAGGCHDCIAVFVARMDAIGVCCA